MKKWTKVMAVVLCTMLFVSLFAGCSDKDGSNGGKTTVSFWSGNTHSRVSLEQIAHEFNETIGKEKNIYFEYIVKEGGSLSQAIDVALQNGDAPDILGTGDTELMIANDQIIAIDDLPGGPELLAEHKDHVWPNSNIYYGKTYTISTQATTQGLVYNKDMFRAAGLVDENGEPTPPETWDEVREYAKILTNTSKQQYGIIFPAKWGSGNGWFNSDILSPAMSINGHFGYDPKTGKYDYSATEEIMNVILGIKEDKTFFPGADSLDNDAARAQFAAGNIGMKFAFSFDAGVFNDQFKAVCDWGVAPYPTLDKGERYGLRMSSSSALGTINKKSVDEGKGEAIMEVIKYLLSDEITLRMYEDGVGIPIDADIVAKSTKTDLPTGWEDFAKLVAISQRYPVTPSDDMGSELQIGERFVNEVWSGQKTPAELIADCNRVKEEAIARYDALHPENQSSLYIDKGWDPLKWTLDDWKNLK